MTLKLKFKNKAISPIIATVLLVVVAVILITVFLSFGKDFSTKGLDKTNSILEITKSSDKQSFIRFEKAENGMYFFDYYIPNNLDANFTITGYSLLGYNDYIPLEPEYTVTHAGKFMLPLGIIDTDRFSIFLLLSDGSYLTFKDVSNRNISSSPSECPTGFVPVPGNYLYGTQNGFCVAQFEMKVDQNNDGIGDSNTFCNSDYNTWKNNVEGCSYDTGTRHLVSSAAGYPLTSISQIDSITACESIGGHLITNNEWMTLARNIERVPSNWSSGIVGDGNIYSGHNDAAPHAALVGDINNDNGYYLTDQTSGNQRRTLILTNGEVVWDLAGNVSEWINKIYNNTDYSIPIFNIEGSLVLTPEYSVLYDVG